MRFKSLFIASSAKNICFSSVPSKLFLLNPNISLIPSSNVNVDSGGTIKKTLALLTSYFISTSTPAVTHLSEKFFNISDRDS